MTEKDYYEGRIATLRTGIELVLQSLEPSLLSDEQRIGLATRSLTILLDSDLDKALEYESGADKRGTIKGIPIQDGRK